MNDLEYRFIDLQKPTGRQVVGVLIEYEKQGIEPISQQSELFEKRAFEVSDSVFCNLNHDRKKIISALGNGLTLEHSDTGITAKIDIPETRFGDKILKQIDDGILKGLSVEFRALEERTIDKTRKIRSAFLEALSIVKNPAYQTSKIVEIRSADYEYQPYQHFEYLPISTLNNLR